VCTLAGVCILEVSNATELYVGVAAQARRPEGRGGAAGARAGVITPTQPKVPEANVRGSYEGFQCVLVSPEKVLGVRKGVPRGPVGPPGPPGPPDLAALAARRPFVTTIVMMRDIGHLLHNL
jgi:hypothetical protein